MQEYVEGSPKQAAAKMHAVLLPAVAKAANDPVLDVREAAMCVLVAFAMKAGSLALLDKVPFSLPDLQSCRDSSCKLSS